MIRVLTIIGLALACTSIAYAQQSANEKLSGTYSSLCYHAEAGDLLGYEIQLIPGRQGSWKAVVQIAEGGAPDVRVATVRRGADGAFLFDVPYLDAKPTAFRATISSSGMRAEISFPKGDRETVFLQRSQGYWNTAKTC